MTGVLIGENRDSDTQGEHHVMTEAETGMTQLQAKERLGLPATSRSWKRQRSTFPESLEREHGLADTLIINFWPPGR